VPFLRRKDQDPEPSEVLPEAPVEPPAPEIDVAAESPEPVLGPLNETAVESQFQPVEGADEMLDMPLGTLIFRAGLIAPQQLEDALAEGLRTGKRLGEVLLARGWLSEEELSRLLAGQKGLPFVDLNTVAIDHDLARSLSYEDARNEIALPLVIEFGVVVVAMSDPTEDAQERIRNLIGPDLRFVVAAPSTLLQRIDEVLGGVPGPSLFTSDAPQPTEPFLAHVPQPETSVPSKPAPEEPVEAESAAAEPAAEELAAKESLPEPQPEAELPTEEITPIGAAGEIDYPIFDSLEVIPKAETLSSKIEELPPEAQTGEYGYYEDSSLLEGAAWQPGDSGYESAREPPYQAPEEGTENRSSEIEPDAEAGPELATQGDNDGTAPERYDDAEERPEAIEQVAETFEGYDDTEERPEGIEQLAETSEEPEPEEESLPEPQDVGLEDASALSALDTGAEDQAPELPEEPPASESLEEASPITPAWARHDLGVTAITAEVADILGVSADGEFPEEAGESEPVEPSSAKELPPEEIAEVAQEAVELTPEESEIAELSTAEEEVAAAAEEPLPYETIADVGEFESAESETAPVEPEPLEPEPVVADIEFVERAASSESAGSTNLTYDVVLKLVDGDTVSIGSSSSESIAQEQAQEVIQQLSSVEPGKWPFIGGRFLRPDTIVSVDIEKHGSWGGSSDRSRGWAADS